VGEIVGDDSGPDEQTGENLRPPSTLADRAIRRKSLKTKGLVLTEQRIRNQQVRGSSPRAGSKTLANHAIST
jgi:hypothetical protein